MYALSVFVAGSFAWHFFGMTVADDGLLERKYKRDLTKFIRDAGY